MLAPTHPFALLDAAMADALAVAHAPGLLRNTDKPRLRDEGDAYALTASAPGVAAADLTVEALDGAMTIKGETRTATHTHFCHFTVALPDDADAEAATATSADGVLSIHLPKRAAPEAVRIAVTTA